ncbi:MAG: hypothetical protein C0402_03540 [Thermodesulfovibrio sp.]|nr:hypothetical protein [Thermodesulfovibrio sp.]
MTAASLVYRLLLLGLLPCIAAIIYFRGQQYDAALIDFKAASETTGQGQPATAQTSGTALTTAAVLPEEKVLSGFRQTGRGKTYTKDNLYEHVNGHAEYFIGAGFVQLSVSEFTAAEAKTSEAELQAEVFDMGSSIQAFGVLSDESGDSGRPASVGTMAFRTSGGINFIKGKYYVKISALNPKAPLLSFAKVFSETLPASRDSFEVFSRLPDLGKVNKTRFIKEGYRGLDFLRNVVEREYSAGDMKITVAMMVGSGAGSAQQLKTLQASFFDYFKKSGMPYEKAVKDGLEFYRVTDKYEGNWLLIPSPDALFGVFGTEDEAVVKYFAKSRG